MAKKMAAPDYGHFLSELKTRVVVSRRDAIFVVNKELIKLYHHIGVEILKAQGMYGWGAKIIDQLSMDLGNAFPAMKGFSPRNLKYMRKFAAEYPDFAIVQAASAQLPWSHNVVLIDKIPDKATRLFYVKQALVHGWSYSILEMHIKNQLHKRQGKAITNFKNTLPAPDSDMAQAAFKDPYIFDFLSADTAMREQEVENTLMQHVEKFLLELGAGFAFIGRQFHLEVGDQDFYIDLLFYHYTLRCFVVIELKARKFEPQDAGQLSLYLSAVDERLKQKEDGPTIGLLLCQSKDHLIVEYVIRNFNRPMGVAQYDVQFFEKLPKEFASKLPSVAEIELELSRKMSPKKRLVRKSAVKRPATKKKVVKKK